MSKEKIKSIEQVRNERVKMEIAITDMIRDFEERSGTVVTRVDIKRDGCFGSWKTVLMEVAVTVELE